MTPRPHVQVLVFATDSQALTAALLKRRSGSAELGPVLHTILEQARTQRVVILPINVRRETLYDADFMSRLIEHPDCLPDVRRLSRSIDTIISEWAGAQESRRHGAGSAAGQVHPWYNSAEQDGGDEVISLL
jgi:hypothetical protein